MIKMIGPSSKISKILLGLLLILVTFYLYLDVQLYLRIQNYPLERNYHFDTRNTTAATSYLHELGWYLKGAIAIVGQFSNTDNTTSLAERAFLDQLNIDSDNSTTTAICLAAESLLRELFVDPLLTKYALIIIEDTHLRSMLIDTVLALLKKIIRKRSKALKLLLISNAKEAQFLNDYFHLHKSTKRTTEIKSVILSVDGDCQDLQKIYYLQKACADYVNKSVELILKIHQNQSVISGDIIVYLVNEDDINDAMTALRNSLNADNIKNLNYFKFCYSNMKNSQQMVIFPRTEGKRNVIFTISLYSKAVANDYINYVIDCGFMTVNWFNSELNRSVDMILPTCKFTAFLRSKWRKGVVNRGAKVYRLYTREQYDLMLNKTVNEMRRCDLCPLVLYLKALAVENVLRFDFPSPPPAKNLLAAIETLYALEALDDKGQLLHPLGYFMADSPMPPMLSRMLFKSVEMKCSNEILTIAAMLLTEPSFIVPTNITAEAHLQVAKRAFEAAEGDLITMLNVYHAFIESEKSKDFCNKYYLNYRNLSRASKLRVYLIDNLFAKYKLPVVSCVNSNVQDNIQQILRCIVAGYFMNVAYLHTSGVYRELRSDSDLYVDRSSAIFGLTQPKYLIYTDIIEKSKTFMKNITVINEDYLTELAPHFYTKRQ